MSDYTGQLSYSSAVSPAAICMPGHLFHTILYVLLRRDIITGVYVHIPRTEMYLFTPEKNILKYTFTTSFPWNK